MRPMNKQVGCEQETALLMDTVLVKRLFQKRFDGCRCHKAFPDQIHTFVGRCEGSGAIVACVPEGDVRFPTASYEGYVQAMFLDLFHIHAVENQLHSFSEQNATIVGRFISLLQGGDISSFHDTSCAPF